jgi:hypothetical protein
VSNSIPGASGDPLPAPPLTEGRWDTIGAGHRLIYIGNDRLLDWMPVVGNYRIFSLNRAAAGSDDPTAGPILCQGRWAKITFDHQLVYLGGDRLLDWVPDEKRFRVWRIDRAAAGAADPLPGAPLTEGIWADIDADHQLVAINPTRVIDWKPSSGDFKVWQQDPAAAGASSPFISPALTQGTWNSIRTNHNLMAVGLDRVLDWVPSTGDLRVWRYDPAAAGDPFPGDPEVTGKWRTIGLNHDLVYLDGDLLLDWEPAGRFRMWRYDRNITTLRRSTVKVHLKILHPPRDPEATVDIMMRNAKALYGSYGIDLIEVSREDPAALGANVSHNNVGPKELVVYFVREMAEEATGCAMHPPDKPGAMVASRDATEWTLAHEIGHVLGLDHMDFVDTRRLMNGEHSGRLIDLPPDLTAAEVATILASDFSQE